MFRAQVKTARCAPPRDQIFGAGWDVLDKTRKTGQLIPPLIVNYQWQDRATGKNHQVVYFFPFLTKDNIRKRERSDRGQRPGYKEFNYVGLRDDNMPRMTLFPKGPRRRAKQQVQPKSRQGA